MADLGRSASLSNVSPTDISPADVGRDDQGVIARIVPINDSAKAAFDGLVQYHDRGLLHEYHKSFVQVAGVAEQDDDDMDCPGVIARRFEGHYVLSLIRPPQMSSGLGWRIGRGLLKAVEKSVDILVIAPEPQLQEDGFDKQKARVHNSLASVHAVIQLNRKSGLLMLGAGDGGKPVDVHDGETGDWIRLVYPEKTCLHQSQTRFRLGLLEFALTYPRLQHDPENVEYAELVIARNVYMAKHLKVKAPHDKIPAVPQQDRHLRNGFRIFGTLGAGGFGLVNAAVDIITGDPVAIKQTVIKQDSHIDDIKAEFEVGQLFPETARGLIRSTRMFCEHGHPGPCNEKPEVVWIVSDLASMDVLALSFNRLPRRSKFGILNDLAAGLATLHTAGIMHRDISEKNCLVLSLYPAKAAICDFGKATKDTAATEAALGPKFMLPPEVDGKTVYTNKIDVWSLGLVFFRMLFPGQRSLPLNEHSYQRVQRMLDAEMQTKNGDGELYRLISAMLQWRADRRPTAEEVLARLEAIEQGGKELSPSTIGPATKRAKRETQAAHGEDDIESTQPYTHPVVPKTFAPDD